MHFRRFCHNLHTPQSYKMSTYLHNLFAQRIGGPGYGLKEAPIYKFERIKRAKRAASAAHPDKELLDFGVGEPDSMADPKVVANLAHEAALPANRGYADNGGPRLRTAAAHYLKEVFGVTANPETEIMHSIGSKAALSILPAALIDPGDVVLMTSPGYPVFGTHATYYGGVVHPLLLTPENKYLPRLDTIPRPILDKAKVLVLNYPNNPTGAVTDLAFFERAVAWAKRHDVIIAHDLAYSEVTFDGYVAPSILEVDGARDVAIEFNSLSKSFNMTGWRIGMAVGNAMLIDALRRVKSNLDSGVPQAVQQMAITALDGPPAAIEAHNDIYRARRDRVIEVLHALGLRVDPPKASLYVWARLPGGESSSAAYAARLIDATGVVVTPGISYGPAGEGYIRLSLTLPDARVEEGLRRLSAFARGETVLNR